MSVPTTRENLGQATIVANVRRRSRAKAVSLAFGGWAVGVASAIAAHALTLVI